MQKTQVTGKAATLLVRSIKLSSSSLGPTIKRLVIFFAIDNYNFVLKILQIIWYR